MGAPVAQPAAPRPPVAGLLGAPDGPPDRLDLALGGEQVALVGHVAQHLAVAEVDQLQHRRHHAPGPPEHQGVELHLEQRLGLEHLARGPSGLVVHDPDRAVGGDVDPVHEAAQQQARVEQRLDVQLALGGLEPARVLQREVAVQDGPAGRQPGRHVGDVRTPRPPAARTSRRARAPPRAAAPRPAPACRAPARGCPLGGQVEEVLEHLVDDGAAHGVGRGRLRQPVDGAEAVEQRAGHEVAGPAGGERAEHVDPVDGRRHPLGRGVLLHAHGHAP